MEADPSSLSIRVGARACGNEGEVVSLAYLWRETPIQAPVVLSYFGSLRTASNTVAHCCAIFLGHLGIDKSKYQREIIWLGNQLFIIIPKSKGNTPHHIASEAVQCPHQSLEGGGQMLKGGKWSQKMTQQIFS